MNRVASTAPPAVVDESNVLIVTASSTLSDRTDWSSAENSIATNYDYTQYVPPSCSEIYGSLAVDSESAMQQPLLSGDNNDRMEAKAEFVDETSVSGETFEAGPRLELQDGAANAYYVVTDDVNGNDTRKGNKSVFRFIQNFGRKHKKGSSSTHVRESNHIDKNNKADKKSGFFGRFKKKTQQSNSSGRTTPKMTFVSSMLTPTTSPTSDNVTPSGLNAFNTITQSALSVPPQMPSTNSLSSVSVFRQTQQDASTADGTLVSDGSRDVTPENTSPVSKSLMPTIICNALDDGSLTDGDDDDDDQKAAVDRSGGDGAVGTNSGDGASVEVEPIEEENEKADANENVEEAEAAVDAQEFDETLTTSAAKDDIVAESKNLRCIDTLVVDNGNEIEMQYHGAQTSVDIQCAESHSLDNTSTTPTKMTRGTSKPTVEPVFLEEDTESDIATVIVSQETVKKQHHAGKKQTMVERGLAFLSKRNNREEALQNSPTGKEEPDVGFQDYQSRSPEYVIESQPERDDIVIYHRGIPTPTENIVAEEQIMRSVPEMPMSMKTEPRGNPDEVSLVSDTDLEEDTVQESSHVEFDDDRSNSSLTFLSYDSTYLSEGSTSGGCGIRGVLLDDLNDAVDDLREGVMDMVAAVRSSPMRRREIQNIV